MKCSHRAIRKGELRLPLFCALLLVAATGWAGDGAGDPRKVLFVGNSFTYYNNSLHNHYRGLYRELYQPVAGATRARIMTISGGYLPEHSAGLPAMLLSEDWDVVVLQGHSRGPISPESSHAFREAAKKFSGLIRDSGAEPVFFMTWAYSDEPDMTALLNEAYTSIGAELDAEVVPVGLAFARASEERPDISLRTADRRHPTLAGTYLAACTFIAALHRRSPVGVQYDAGLGDEVAVFLQSVAWETAEAYRSDNSRTE